MRHVKQYLALALVSCIFPCTSALADKITVTTPPSQPQSTENTAKEWQPKVWGAKEVQSYCEKRFKGMSSHIQECISNNSDKIGQPYKPEAVPPTSQRVHVRH